MPNFREACIESIESIESIELIESAKLESERAMAQRGWWVGRFIGLSVFGSRNQAKDHRLRTVQ